MIPLATTQRVMTWFCVCYPEEMVPKWKDIFYKFAYKVITFVFAASLVSNFIASITFFWTYVFEDFEKALYIIWQAPASFSTFYVLVIAILTRDKINSIFKILARIYRANANTESFQFLEQANNRSELIWRIYLKSVEYLFLFAFIIFMTVLLYFWWLCGCFDRESVYNTVLFVLPWDRSTFFGYLIGEFSFAYFYGTAYFIVNGSFLLFFLSICQYHMAYYEMFRRSAQQLDQIDKQRNNKQCLCNLIRFHRSIKRWFWKTADIYSPCIMVNFICFIITLASATFQLDMQFKHIQLGLGFYVLISAALGALANLFVYCFFGMLATESYEKMADSLYDVNWQDFPVELQKYFFVMILNMQKPLFYHGFGICVLKLETFATILQTVSSYFMMFKTLTFQ